MDDGFSRTDLPCRLDFQRHPFDPARTSGTIFQRPRCTRASFLRRDAARLPVKFATWFSQPACRALRQQHLNASPVRFSAFCIDRPDDQASSGCSSCTWTAAPLAQIEQAPVALPRPTGTGISSATIQQSWSDAALAERRCQPVDSRHRICRDVLPNDIAARKPQCNAALMRPVKQHSFGCRCGAPGPIPAPEKDRLSS